MDTTDDTTTRQSRSVVALAAGVVIITAVIWALAMGHLVSIPMPLVWILPFIDIVIVAGVVLWEAGLFDKSRS